MTKHELIIELGRHGLYLMPDEDGWYSIRRNGIANPILFFDGKLSPKTYKGTIEIKSINATLYRGDQLVNGCHIVHRYLSTEIKDRKDDRL